MGPSKYKGSVKGSKNSLGLTRSYLNAPENNQSTIFNMAEFSLDPRRSGVMHSIANLEESARNWFQGVQGSVENFPGHRGKPKKRIHSEGMDTDQLGVDTGVYSCIDSPVYKSEIMGQNLPELHRNFSETANPNQDLTPG